MFIWYGSWDILYTGNVLFMTQFRFLVGRFVSELSVGWNFNFKYLHRNLSSVIYPKNSLFYICIYIYTHTFTYIYIYIYVCVCVCTLTQLQTSLSHFPSSKLSPLPQKSQIQTWPLSLFSRTYPNPRLSVVCTRVSTLSWFWRRLWEMASSLSALNLLLPLDSGLLAMMTAMLG
jgi:hypothetical protein